jgi:hypothetical protein
VPEHPKDMNLDMMEAWAIYEHIIKDPEKKRALCVKALEKSLSEIEYHVDHSKQKLEAELEFVSSVPLNSTTYIGDVHLKPVEQ